MGIVGVVNLQGTDKVVALPILKVSRIHGKSRHGTELVKLTRLKFSKDQPHYWEA